MFSLNFWKKYICRVMKLLSIIILCHQVISAKFTGKTTKEFQTWYTAAGIICIVSGAASIVLYNPSLMGDKKQLWLIFQYFKLIVTGLLFTPLLKYIPLSKKGKLELQFYSMLLFIILSPFARYYRELFSKRQKQLRQKESSNE